MKRALDGWTQPTEPTEQQVREALDVIDMNVLRGEGDPISLGQRYYSKALGAGDLAEARVWSKALACYQPAQQLGGAA